MTTRSTYLGMEDTDLSSFPQAGDQMRYTGTGGTDHERSVAQSWLTTGEVYTVQDCEVGLYSTAIFVKGIPWRGFNSCLFEKVTP